MNTEFPELHEIMGRCYGDWQTDIMEKQISYADFLLSLSPIDRSVVVCANLNNQVENGGFEQWFENGYDVGTSYLFWALNSIQTKNCKKVSNLLAVALEAKNEMSEFENEHDSPEIDGILEGLDKLDTEYYKISGAFMKDLSDWVQKQTQ